MLLKMDGEHSTEKEDGRKKKKKAFEHHKSSIKHLALEK